MANVKVKINTKKLKTAIQGTQKALKEAVNDCIDDLVRTSSETAPHDKGILERSWSKQVTLIGDKAEGTVQYAVRENHSGGTYNYALAMHERNYQLGAGSRAKPGGMGMSGKRYTVGKKFLSRPLEGEKEAYAKHIAESVKRELE